MCLAGALSAAASVQSLALAQGVALDRFEPAPAGDRLFGVESPYVAGDATPHVAMIFDYGHNPYTLRHGPGLADPNAVVSEQLFLHLNASIAIAHRVNLSFSVPAAINQDGSDPTDGRTTYLSPHGSEFGDIRLGVRIALYGHYDDPFQVAVAGTMWLPTGASNSYVSDGKVRGMPSVILGGRMPHLVWSFSTGVEIRPFQYVGGDANTGIPSGPGMQLGAGVGLVFADGKAQVGPEIKTSLLFKKVDLKTTNAELILGAKYRIFDDFELGVAAGPGLTSGMGTPDVRVIGMAAFTPRMKPASQDRDGDMVPDAEDACPDVPAARDLNPAKPGCPAEPDRDGDKVPDAQDACPDKPGAPSPDAKQNGCPPDRDGDMIPDAQDACPDVKGEASPDPAKNGCPAPKDRDGDGILDSEDACPDIPGIKSNDPKQNGCPGDRDGDGIRDDLDACPDVKGVPSKDPKKNGCPRAQVSEKEILILEQVEFDTGKATIKPESDHLIAEVAGLFKEHLDITKVEVQGHTDNVGAKNMNKQLSANRAEAVKKALVSKGVEGRRLVAKGYGEEKPIADNKTDEGRAINRRVQFVILERKAPKAKDAPPPPKAPPAKAPAAKAPPAKAPAKAPAKKK
jgi:outer membrane protein OmpA-like peptidoglycan-associated protein